ncbi:MAG: acyltransferase family protein, partial [Clostridia bacterium]|nr:acyltransferase family protein [Clostridia bacterium]
CMSMDKTASIKGVFILLVFFSHFNSYTHFNGGFDKIYVAFFNYIGQAMVTMFLFYSGFGIMESIKNKKNYIKTMPKKRMLNLLIQFDVAVLIFAIIKILCKEEIPLRRLLLSFVGWESLGNSNWYIFTILLLYIFTYVAFSISSRYSISTMVVTALSCIYILFCVYTDIKPTYWYDTLICFPIGIFFSNYKAKIDSMIPKTIKNYFLLLTGMLLILGFATLFNHGNFGLVLMRNIIFTLTVVLITYRFSFNNKALQWCGYHLFELFILQRIPMIFCKNIGLIAWNKSIAFVICLLTTLVIAFYYRKIIPKLSAKMLKI